MSNLKTLCMDIETELDYCLNDLSMTNKQAFSHIKRKSFIVKHNYFQGEFCKKIAEQLIRERQEN